MPWEVYGRELSTADASNTNVYQPITPQREIILKAIRTWIILVGDPTFTSVQMRIYSNNSADNTPGSILYTSTNSIAKATLLETESHGVKETYFEFLEGGAEGITLRANVRYNLVLLFNGASSWSSTSHCAWRRAYPDPVYNRSDVTYNDLLVSPFMITGVVASTDF